MKYIYIIKPREKSNEDKDLIFFLLFINNVCHASKVRTVPFTNCRHIGHFRMARAQYTTTKMSFSVQILHILRSISCIFSSINNRVSVRGRSEKDFTSLRLIIYQFNHFTCLNLMICKVSKAPLIRVLLVILLLL